MPNNNGGEQFGVYLNFFFLMGKAIQYGRMSTYNLLNTVIVHLSRNLEISDIWTNHPEAKLSCLIKITKL